MKTTNNYGLKKPEKNEFFNVDDSNYNADVLDAKLNEYENYNNYKPLYTGNTESEIDAIYNNLHTNATNGKVYRAKVHHAVVHSLLSGGDRCVEGYRASETYGWQKITGYMGGQEFYRLMSGGTWSAWDKYALTSNLVKYLPATGDVTAKLAINSTVPLNVNNSHASGDMSAIHFTVNALSLGYLGFEGVNTPKFMTDGGLKYNLLHTGNSAPVIISATAPTDTTVLWVDTTAMKMKIYKNSAWTALT